MARRILALMMLAWFASLANAYDGNLPEGVRVRAGVKAPSSPGQSAKFFLTISLDKGWIAYDIEQGQGSALPTQVTFENSSTFTPIESLVGPTPKEKADPSHDGRIVRYFDESPTFERNLYVSPYATPGNWSVVGSLDFEVCNTSTGRCYIIRSHPIQTNLKVVPKSTLVPIADTPTEPSVKRSSQGLAKAETPVISANGEATPLTTSDASKAVSPPVKNANSPSAKMPADDSKIPSVVAPKLQLKSTPEITAKETKPPVLAAPPVAEKPQPPTKSDLSSPLLPSNSVANVESVKVPNETMPRANPWNKVPSKESSAKADIVFEPGKSGLAFTSDSGSFWDKFVGSYRAVNFSVKMWWPIAFAFLLGVIAVVAARSFGATAKSRIAGFLASIFCSAAVVAVGFVVATAVYQWTLIGIGAFVSLWLLWRSAESSDLDVNNDPFTDVELWDKRTITAWPLCVALAIIALLAAHNSGSTNPITFAFASFLIGQIIGEAIGAVKTIACKITRTSKQRWTHPSLISLPSVHDLLCGLTAIGFTVSTFVRADPFEGAVAWLNERFIHGVWTGCAAVATVRMFVPWPEAARGVFLRGTRLISTCLLLLFTITMAYRCLIAD